MNGPTHALGGLAVGAALALTMPAQPLHVATITLPREVTIVTGLVLAMVAGLAPDRIQYHIKSVRWPLEGHRGCSHTLLFVIVTALLFRSELAVYWAGGILSHLLLDVITIAGIPLWWPLRVRRVSLSLTKNGSAGEAVLRALLSVGVLLMFIDLFFM